MGRNEELVREIQNGQTQFMAELWEDNQRLVSRIATRYKSFCGKSCDVDDLMQAGYIGMYIAAVAYAPDRDAKFSTYAVFHLRKAMRQVVGLYGRRDLILDADSLDAPIGNDDGDTLLDFQSSPAEERSVEQGDLARIVRNAVSRIKNNKVRDSVEAIYWDGQSVGEYADAEGITDKAVYARLQNAYWMLRKDPAIVSLAIAEGYDTARYKIQYLGVSPEAVTIRQDAFDREQSSLYSLLGDLIKL